MIGAALLMLLSVEVLNYTGFCYADRRVRSDAEYLRVAIEQEIGRVSDEEIFYASAEEFVRRNPGCCQFDRWRTYTNGHQLLSRLFGFYAGASLLYRSREGGTEPYYSSEYVLDACARNVEWRGIDLSPQSYRAQLGR